MREMYVAGHGDTRVAVAAPGRCACIGLAPSALVTARAEETDERIEPGCVAGFVGSGGACCFALSRPSIPTA